jgi:hypothetical protein
MFNRVGYSYYLHYLLKYFTQHENLEDVGVTDAAKSVVLKFVKQAFGRQKVVQDVEHRKSTQLKLHPCLCEHLSVICKRILPAMFNNSSSHANSRNQHNDNLGSYSSNARRRRRSEELMQALEMTDIVTNPPSQAHTHNHVLSRTNNNESHSQNNLGDGYRKNDENKLKLSPLPSDNSHSHPNHIIPPDDQNDLEFKSKSVSNSHSLFRQWSSLFKASLIKQKRYHSFLRLSPYLYRPCFFHLLSEFDYSAATPLLSRQ